MPDVGVNVTITIKNTTADLQKQVLDAIGTIDLSDKLTVTKKNGQLSEKILGAINQIDIGNLLTVNSEKASGLSKTLQEALDSATYTVNVGNVKLLGTAKTKMKEQIESMFGYSTNESTVETKELQKQLDLLQKKNAALESSLALTKKSNAQKEAEKQRIQEQTILLRNQKDAISAAYNEAKKLVSGAKGGIDYGNLTERLTNLKEQINEINVRKSVLSEEEKADLISDLNTLGESARKTAEMTKRMKEEAKAAEAAIKQQNAEAKKSEEDRISLLQKSEEIYVRLLASHEKFRNSEAYKSGGEYAEGMERNFQSAIEQMESLRSSSESYNNEAIKGIYDQANGIMRIQSATQGLVNTEKSRINTIKQATNLYSQMSRLLSSNPRLAISDTGVEIKSLMSDLDARIKNGTATPEYLAQVNKELATLKSRGQELNLLGKEGDSIFKQLLSRFSVIGVVMTGIRKLMSAVKDMVVHVKELDAAMTELRKVTTETDAGYNKFFNEAGARATELGVTVRDIISATADFARLGYSLADASDLADAATVYKNVGDGITGIDDAAESLISTMKAFGDESYSAMQIVDRFNEVGNNFAISSKGVGDALIRSASALSAANNTLDESIALVTAMNTTVQNPEKVGNALKTLAAYLRSSSVELEELGETGEMVANTTPKLHAKMVALTHGAVQILEQDGVTIRSTYDIMRDLSKIWDTGALNDTEQAAILEMIAGKRQSSTVASLLQNFATAEDVLATSANAAGSAMKENEKYLDSINGKIAQAEAAWERLSATIINSDFIKNLYSFKANVIDTIADIIHGAEGLWANPLMMTASGLFGGALGFSQNANPIDLVKAVGSLFSGRGVYEDIKNAGGIIDEFNKKLVVSRETALEFAGGLDDSVSASLKEYLMGIKEGAASTDGYTLALKNSGQSLAAYTIRTTAAKIATQALNAAFSAAVSMLASWLISAAMKVIDDFVHRLDNAVEKTEKLKSDWVEFDRTNKENIKTIEDMSEEFERLSKGVDKNGKNVSLAADEYETYRGMVDKIVELNPSLIQGYNDERQAIINNNDALEKSIELLKEQYRLKVRDKSAPSNLAEEMQGYAASYQQAEKAMSDARRSYGATALTFFKGGNNKKSINAREVLLAAGYSEDDVSGILSSPQFKALYGSRKDGAGFDYEEFGALLADRIVGRLDEINPEAFGYKNLIEMQEAYKSVLAEAAKVSDQQYSMTDALKQMSGSLQYTAMADENWENLSAPMQGIVFDYIDHYVSNIETLTTRGLFTGDYKVAEEKIIQANTAIRKYIGSLLDENVQSAIKAVEDLQKEFSSGGISADEYRNRSSSMLRGWTGTLSQPVLVMLKAQIDSVNLEEEVNAAVDGIQSKINGIMETLTVDAQGFADAFDFSDAITSIDNVGSSLANLSTALLTVRDGTMLTEQEISKLISEYPELASAANLYAADTIEGQQSILENFLQTKEAEYNAEIDTQIAKLEAEQSLLEMQIEAENQKLTAINEMRTKMDEASLKGSGAYQAALDEIREKGAENYATIKDGEVAYNADALSRTLASDINYGEQSNSNVWEPHADDIAGSVDAAYKAATEELDNMLAAEITALESFRVNTLVPFSNDVARALTGEDTRGGYNSGYKARGGYRSVDPRHKGTAVTRDDSIILMESGVPVVPEVDKSVYDQVNEKITAYLDASEKIATQNRKIYEAELDSIRNQISTLQSVKNLDLVSHYGTAPKTSSSSAKDSDGSGKSGSKSGSSGSASEAKQVEEYVAEIDKYYKAEKKLADAQYNRVQLERELENTDDLAEKIRIERDLLSVYEDESAAQEEIRRQKQETIEQNAEVLRQLGFEVDYNAATSTLYIDNMEHLNEIVADSKGDFETMEEATNEVRKTTEELIKSTETLAGECGEAGNAMYDLSQDVEQAKESIVSYLQEMVSKANEVVDGFQNVYDIFTQAAKEFASTGYLSVDSLQSILALGPKYLGFLFDEEEQLRIDKTAIQMVTEARIRDMGVQTAYAHVMQIIEALNNDDEEALKNLVQITSELTDETWGSVYALAAQADTLAKSKGKTDLFSESAVEQVRKIEAMTRTTLSTTREYWASLGDEYTTQKDALDEVIEQTIEYIKWQNEQKSDAIEKEKDDYKDIIESRKEALRLAKEEDKRNMEIEDKLREIAKIQRKIDQLSLDDSREARAQKASLEEELYELQKTMAEDSADNGISVAEDALDKQYDAFEDEKDKELKALEKETQSYQKLWDQATERLQNDWDNTYKLILAYNHEYGNDLDKNVTAKWEQAIKAVERYGSVVNAIEGTKSDEYIGGNSAPEYDAFLAKAQAAAESMRANSIAWLTASPEKRKELEAANERLGFGAGMTKANGAWYLPNGERAYQLTNAEYAAPLTTKIAANLVAMVTANAEKRKQLQEENKYLEETLKSVRGMMTFHSGGVVGIPTEDQNETLAVLQKGEAVLDSQKQAAMFKLVDFATLLQNRLGKTFDASALSGFSRTAVPSLPILGAMAGGISGGMNFAPNVTVEINHNGSLDETDARRYGDIAADAVLGKLSDAFGRRGISNFGSTLLRSET